MTYVDAVVTGAGGFIGGHLTKALLAEGRTVRAVDVKPLELWQQLHEDAENLVRDLTLLPDCRKVVSGGAGEVFNLAADMGGMGFIENNKAACMLSVLTSTHMLMAARDAGVSRFFYSSSACVYPDYKQTDSDVVALREQDAYPAMPEDGYGWEKLFSERMARHFSEDFGLPTRIARYHNVYGPHGTWRGGREKAPAAICRKVATAIVTGSGQIAIWGDGEQTRSFTFIDDCIQGTLRIARGDWTEPINLGSSEIVTINQLVDLVESIAGVHLSRIYEPNAPTGVRGRNSDNALIARQFNWEPNTPLRSGLAITYEWVSSQVASHLARR